MIKELKNISVLVTGATGFIGSHLTRQLVSLGADVNVFVRKNSSIWRIKDVIEKIKVFDVDITDSAAVREALHEIKPVKVYHLAASVDVTRSFDLIAKMISVNIKGTMNLLYALEGCKFDCFVNTGTSEEYGDNNVPFEETQRENPVSPYSATKVATTYLCQMLYKIQNLPIVTLRPFLTYGPYQTGNMLIPSLISKCLQGKDFEMTKGEQTREFNYVSDIVDGYIKASITEKAIGEVINIGNGVEYRIKEVVELIVRLSGSKIKPRMGALPYRPGETMRSYCSNNKAKELLGWKAQVSLQEGLQRTIQAVQKASPFP